MQLALTGLKQKVPQRQNQHQCAHHVSDEHKSEQDPHVSLKLDGRQ